MKGRVKSGLWEVCWSCHKDWSFKCKLLSHGYRPEVAAQGDFMTSPSCHPSRFWNRILHPDFPFGDGPPFPKDGKQKRISAKDPI